jgi:signal transduction histidine kinase
MFKKTSYEGMYNAFREISRLVHSSRTSEEVLQRVVWKSSELVRAKGALLRIHNPETRQFEVAAAYGLGERYLSKGPVSNESILADLDGPDKVVVIRDVWDAPRVEYPQEAWDEGIRMMLDIPLSVDFDIVGILRIFLSERREFTEEEMNFMVYIAEQCACAIQKARFIEMQKARYDQLAIQTEKLSALGRMAAGIAHEINNPLAGILLFSTNLSKKVPPEGPLKEGLDIIVRETVRCKSIIQELLEFSRDREPRMVPTDVNDVIEKALTILENEFRLQHIELQKQLAADIEPIRLDSNQIEQVMVNILLNAVHATPAKGTIIVQSKMRPDANQVRVVISDTGCGIAPENLSKIFEPFFSTKEKGTGLGLAVSYGIVKNHGGHIRVDSQPGEGTRFTIDFPVRREDPTPRRAVGPKVR